MVKGLMVLNSSYVGCRDIYWQNEPCDGAVVGYNIYRAFDLPCDWVKLNSIPIPFHYWRDQTTLRQVTVPVEQQDWQEAGELGHYIIHLKDIPFQKWGDEQRRMRPVASNSPSDVAVSINGTWYRPTRVVALDKAVWLQVDDTLKTGGAVSDTEAIPYTQSSAPQTVTAPPGEAIYPPSESPITLQDVKITYWKLENYVDIFTNLTRTYYTVVPVKKDGTEEHVPGDPRSEMVDNYAVENMDWMQAEMVRRNGWLFEQRGEPAWLMFRRTRGVICACATTGTGQARTACPACYETGIVGGYFGPFAFLYVDPDTALTRQIMEGGIKVSRDSRSYLGPVPIVQDGDMIIRRNGERLVIAGVTYTMPRGTILQQEFNSSLLPPGDTRYLVPVVQEPFPPEIYNPTKTPGYLDEATGIFAPVPGQPPKGGEPVVTENEHPGGDVQIGRTITWGNVQSG
jgi:hypothetical protein